MIYLQCKVVYNYLTINEEEYTITWHPDHLKIVEQVLNNN